MQHSPISVWTFDQLQEGQQYSFEVNVTESDLDSFSALVGDANPLHMISEFALMRGFDNRVIHGALLVGLVSRLVGMHLPGEHCLLQEVALKFLKPAYVGDQLTVRGVVDQLSAAVQAIIVRVEIASVARGAILAKGKAVVGFTRERSQ